MFFEDVLFNKSLSKTPTSLQLGKLTFVQFKNITGKCLQPEFFLVKRKYDLNQII